MTTPHLTTVPAHRPHTEVPVARSSKIVIRLYEDDRDPVLGDPQRRWCAISRLSRGVRWAPTRRGALRLMLAFLRSRRFKITRGRYEVRAYPRPLPLMKEPLIVVQNPKNPGEYYAHLSGGPHLRGFGATPGEAEANARDILADQGFAGRIGEVIRQY